jgi:c-di-AMP phosphodiesterase-like protein
LGGQIFFEKITLNIFKKVTSLHIKKSLKKNTFLALTYSKIRFVQNLKIDEELIYLANFVEKLFSKTHLDESKSAKNTSFCDVTKVDNFDKKCLTLSKNVLLR